MKQVLSFLLVFAVCHSASIAGSVLPQISPEDLLEQQKASGGVLVIDLRSQAEYEVGHVPGALNIPPAKLRLHLDTIRDSGTTVLYCIVGKRTREAGVILSSLDVDNVFRLQGGFGAWIRRDFAIEKGSGLTN